MTDATPYDALLLVSFGGPEGPDDVLPFLENVTRGRGIPRERLTTVAQHYLRFGGVSPINGQNRALIAAIEADFAEHGVRLPVYWGNRNWTPLLSDAFAEMADDGVSRVLAVLTSAYSSYSGCRQYRENLADAAASVGDRAPQVDRVRHYYNHPGFVSATVARIRTAIDELPMPARAGAHLVFVTHSIPVGMNESSGPAGGAYTGQHEDVAIVVTAALAQVEGHRREHALVFCSRSGPPTQPWLEPDVNDHLSRIAAEGASGAVIVPIGFVSDHMEVRYDLDTEALATAAAVGLPCVRAATVGTDPGFVAAIRELVLERAAMLRGGQPRRPALGERGADHDICPAGCCPNLRDPGRPALCGAD